MYYSKLVNEIINDTAMFDAESAYAVYNAGKEEIEESCAAKLQQHIEKYHESANGISVLNNFMRTDFDIPSGFIDMSSEKDIKNDYIERIFTGDSSDKKILAKSSNSIMNKD